MSRLLDYDALSAEYAYYHRSPGNRRWHAVGIPLIVFSVVVWSQVGSAFPLAALILPLYFAWDRRVGLVMTGFVAACAALGPVVAAWVPWTAFVLGWAAQFYGHRVHERNCPALFDKLLHVLVGPAFIAEKLVGSRR